MESLGVTAGIAFAALSAEVGLSVRAFAESQAATRQLNQALQNQGIFTAKLAGDYKKYSDSVQDATGIDNDAIIKSQALLQSRIGATEITKEMTLAIADLSTATQGNTDAAAELIAKGINGHMRGLQQLGIVVDEHLTKEQRTAEILRQVAILHGGQAEAANKGLGAIKGLARGFDDFQKALGERFAPAMELAVKLASDLFKFLNDEKNKWIVDLAASFLTAGLAVAGMGTAIAGATLVFIKLKEMMTASKIATEAMTLATRGLVGATGIGALILIGTELYLNWNTIFPKIQAIYKAFSDNIGSISKSLGDVVEGVLHMDPAKIKDGLEKAKVAITTGWKEIGENEVKIAKETTEKVDVQNKQKRTNALKLQDEMQGDRNREKAVFDAERALAKAKAESASAETIALKTKELDTLKAIQDKNNAEIRGQLTKNYEDTQAAEAQATVNQTQATEDYLRLKQGRYNKFYEMTKEERDKSNLEELQGNRNYQEMSAQERALFDQQNEDALKKSLLTRGQAKSAFVLQDMQADIDRRNTFLKTEASHGKAVADLESLLGNKKVAQASGLAGQLMQMQNSKNETLKSIGKAAAVTQITIDTKTSAMSIFKGFAEFVPGPLGIILGLAGGAAAVAYGAEQVAGVLGAARGGLITGGIPGVDSVPAMLTPGELVTPAKNFDEVVNSVADRRNGNAQNSGNSESGYGRIEISLTDNLMEFIETRIVERQRIGISILQGAI
jgi:hypothetical protein